MNANIHDIPVRTLEGKDTTLAAWQGKVLLIVNVASKCGFTPQYKGLEELWRKYADKGLVVMGFPCNQFGAQEPGDAEEIANFCSLTYDVSFPMFAKVDVNGDNAHPLFQHLKRAQKGILGTEGIKWNFTKFLVGRDGQVIDRYASATTPADLEQAIEKALAA